jgi:hypothetical protein
LYSSTNTPIFDLRILVGAGQEDDGGLARSLVLAHAARGLETVHDRHAGIQQRHREIIAQDAFQRLLSGVCDNHLEARRLQQFPHRHQALGIVVDDQNASLRCDRAQRTPLFQRMLPEKS